MKKFINSAAALAFAIAIAFCNCSARPSSGNETEQYHCPMKCEGEKIYDKPGRCPVCGMNLVKIATKNNFPATVQKVKITGSMMNTMHKGVLSGTIDLDTISNKEHLYGLAPLDYLTGEILIVDGKSYVARVAPDGSIEMEETYKVKAPFFVSQNVPDWKELSLPDSISTIPQLEAFLNIASKDHSRPFAFRLTATFESCKIHVVNLSPGTVVHSMEDSHKGERSYDLMNENSELVGFFSTKHKGVFTHHSSLVHIHLITADKKKMGHVDNISIKKGTARLYLPKE
jgi:acetolactate decarboxylase